MLIRAQLQPGRCRTRRYREPGSCCFKWFIPCGVFCYCRTLLKWFFKIFPKYIRKHTAMAHSWCFTWCHWLLDWSCDVKLWEPALLSIPGCLLWLLLHTSTKLYLVKWWCCVCLNHKTANQCSLLAFYSSRILKLFATFAPLLSVTSVRRNQAHCHWRVSPLTDIGKLLEWLYCHLVSGRLLNGFVFKTGNSTRTPLKTTEHGYFNSIF